MFDLSAVERIVATLGTRRLPPCSVRAAVCLTAMASLHFGMTSNDNLTVAATTMCLAGVIIVGVIQSVSTLLRAATSLAAFGSWSGYLEPGSSQSAAAKIVSAVAARVPWALLVAWAIDRMCNHDDNTTALAAAVDINLVGCGVAWALGFDPPDIGFSTTCRRRRQRGQS